MLNNVNQYVINRPTNNRNPVYAKFVGDSFTSNTQSKFFQDHLSISHVQPISFGYYFEFKKLKGLPCPCCGKEMTTTTELNEFAETMRNATDGKIVENLKCYIDRLPDTEREVANMLVAAADEYPNLKLDALINAISKEPKQRLENRQREILEEIKNCSLDLSEGSTKKAIEKDIIAINSIISEGRNGNPFKRKTLIKGMEKLRDNEPDKDNKMVLEQILGIAKNLPTSSSDANAFIVKYSRRKPNEIAYRLLEPSLSTAEHIKPHSKYGKNSPENYLAECKKCNNDRMSISYVDWLKIHPEMKNNTQIYMNEIINRIIKGEIRGYDYYPAAVKKAIGQESNNLINLDITKLQEYKKSKYKTSSENIAFSAGFRFNAII